MGIYHGRSEIAVAQQFLDGPDIAIGLKKVGRVTVAKGVRRNSLQKLRFLTALLMAF
jgi:hypothetical protein